MTDTITRTPYPNLPEDFWEVMEDTRTAQGLTQNDVCKALHWGRATISQYKNGHQDISYERAKALLDALGIDDYYLPEPDLSGLKIVPENETDQLGEIVDPPNAADLLEERIKEAKELEIDLDEFALDIFTYKVSTIVDKLQQIRFAGTPNFKDYIMQDVRADLLSLLYNIEEGWRSIGE